MSGRILQIDSNTTNRILFCAELLAAGYDVRACATLDEARAIIVAEMFDLVVIDVSAPAEPALAFCAGLRRDAMLAAIPIIATGCHADPAVRLTALQAGANDVLDHAVGGVRLHARIRSLLRTRDTVAELRLREDTRRALGFAEASEGFDGAPATGHVAILSPSTPGTSTLLRAFCASLNGHCSILDPAQVLASDMLDPVPDLFVIDVSDGVMSGAGTCDLYRLLSELRSRSETRHAAQLVILPAQPHDMAAMALDLGANDLASADVCAEELAHRARALLRLKCQQDRLRETVRNGLQAAVTDPLTGLYNRRYALPHLAKIADRARNSGRDFAVMALDIDHFKSINDAFGHGAGDRVLVEVAQRLRDNLRAVDLVARTGGEEFLVVMPDTNGEQVRGAAERLRRVIGDAGFDARPPTALGRAYEAGAKISVTLSIGVALGQSHGAAREDVDLILQRADAALYAAKDAGRNTVTFSLSAA